MDRFDKVGRTTHYLSGAVNIACIESCVMNLGDPHWFRKGTNVQSARSYEDIRIERFWRTIKYEDINVKHYGNMVDLRQGIAQFIDYYKNERLLQVLQYRYLRYVYFG